MKSIDLYILFLSLENFFIIIYYYNCNKLIFVTLLDNGSKLLYLQL